MDKSRKLTEEWKIRKRKSAHTNSFKELIDFELSSPDDKLKSHMKATKAINNHNNVSKNSKKSSNENTSRNNSNFKPRRSERVQKISSGNSFQKIKSQGSQPSLLQVQHEKNEKEKTSLIYENEEQKLSNEDTYHDLSEWGLPPSVLLAYKSRNIHTMFQWQYECLSMKNVLEGGNLVYSAPTSAGKTLVAEILMLKKVTEAKKKAIMILPFVSVVREKVNYFKEMFQSAGIVVDGYMGAHNPPGGFKSVDIAICTIEKANNLINRLMEEKRLDELGVLVVDELHMIGDYGRGYLLELLLTKLLYNCKRSSIGVQIVGMSATLPNLSVISFWLQSELYCTDFRPVPLSEMFKVGSIVYSAQTKLPARDLAKCDLSFPEDSDHSVHLSIETVAEGNGVLIFCPSKNWCENLATTIAKAIYVIGNPNNTNKKTAMKEIGEKLRLHLDGSKLSDIILQLKNSPAGLDSVLSRTVPFGVAFHHAGLTFDERDIVEGAFRQGILKVLVATTTLSSGVNLPARRVIIRSPLFCGAPIDVLSYKQMVGRAGRKGIDDEGESILLCKEVEKNVALTLVGSELQPVKSCLIKAGSTSLHSSLKRALIEVIASGVASSRREVLQYVSCTLLFATLASEHQDESSNSSMESSIDDCISYLIENDIIFKHEDEMEVAYKPSRLGLAILASGFSPEDALRVLKELQLARRCFVLENDLHLLYEVTPPYLSDQMGALNWMHFLTLWEQLPEEYKRVGELVGVQESFIGLGVQGRINKNAHKTGHKLAVHQRFYATLALNDLIQEMPLPVVSSKYGCSRGILQSLQQTTSTFAGMLTIFCNRLGWHNLELLFSSFQRRVHFGVQQELCDLIQLSTLNAQRARALYNAGFETVASLASADPQELALLLCNMGSFESAKQLEGDLAQEALQRSEAKRIRIIGKQGVNEKEAAVLIVQEAQYFIKQELGLNKVSWNNVSNSSTSDKKDAAHNGTFLSKEGKNKSVLANESIQIPEIMEKSEKSLIIPSNKSSLNSSLHLNNTCPVIENSDTTTSSSEKQPLIPPLVEMNSRNETSDQSKDKTFFFDSSDKFSFLETSAKKTELRKEDEMKGSVNMEDDLCFSELLLSQTANGDNVYFAESFCASHDSSNHNASLRNTIGKERKNSEDLNFSNLVCSMKESDFSFELPNMNCTKINMCLDSIFSELESTRLAENISSISQGIEENNIVLKSPNTIKSKHNKENIFIDQSLKNNPPINRIKTFHDHSTPLRQMVNGFSPLPLNERKNFVDIELDSLDKKCGRITDGEDKITNETSGELFECEESIEEKQLNDNSPVNPTKNVSKDKMMVIENSDELFEDLSFEDVAKYATECHHNSIESKSVNETSKTPCKRKCSALDNCDEIEPPCAINNKSKDLVTSKNRTKETPQNRLCSERNSIELVMAKHADIDKKSPQNYSEFWKSWESSEMNLSVSKCENVNTELNEKKNPDTNKSDSLILDSGENSLFKSFDSDCLSPTPNKKVDKSQMLEKMKTPLRGSGSPIQVLKSQKRCESPMEYYENLPFLNNTSVCLDEADNEYYIKVIDIPDSDLEKFLTCLNKVESFSFSVSCEKVKEKGKSIGPPKSKKNLSPRKNKCFIEPDIAVTGFSFCCGKASFYIPITDKVSESFLGNMPSSPIDFPKKMSLIKEFFHTYAHTATMIVHDLKSQYRVLWQGCGISLQHRCMDPSVASWLLDPALGEQPLKMLVNQYLPTASPLLKGLDYGRGSLGLRHCNSIPGKQRSSIEVYISYHLMDKLRDVLKEQQLYNAFTETEMPSILALAKMEQNGLGFNATLAVSYQKKLEKKQQEILEDSYKIAGRRFNILSSREVSRILFKELKLSPSITPDSPLTRKYLSVGTSVRSRRLPPELKTNKECLEKIIHLHPLPKAILDWRRLSFATTKVLMPLLRNNKYDNFFCMNRLYSTCYLYTLTGRVNVHSPNLQFVPRDFNVNSTGNGSDDCQESKEEEEYQSSEDEILQYGISLRNLFIPFKGNVILAADYSQLELRILAHLSKEKNLLSSLNSGDDVFKKIASTWKGIPINSVTDEYRQQAKKICYGMIYGISANTLAVQLNTTKENATIFMETFKKSYPGLTKYFDSVTQSCLEKGYVTTLMNRRRYLPLIKSLKKTEQLQAERQAINTTIQGSAADLLKAAMINIEMELSKVFPDSSTPYSLQNLDTQSRKKNPKVCRGGFLVLQMHDELIYEVCLKDLSTVVQIVKNAMEKTTTLLVDLPVKIRTGNSWGNLSEYRNF